jgi:hypothetical protein
MYNLLIKPIITFGLESLPVLYEHRSKLTAVEMK